LKPKNERTNENAMSDELTRARLSEKKEKKKSIKYRLKENKRMRIGRFSSYIHHHHHHSLPVLQHILLILFTLSLSLSVFCLFKFTYKLTMIIIVIIIITRCNNIIIVI
jgi:hypothetical protein